MKRSRGIVICTSAVTLLGIAGFISISYAMTNNEKNTSSGYEYYYTKNPEETDSDYMNTFNPDLSADSNTGIYDETYNEDSTVPFPLDLDPDSMAVLVNRQYPLPDGYAPDDLIAPEIPFNFTYDDDKRYMREEAAQAIESLFADAESEGLSLCAVSGYRSFDRQTRIYQDNLKKQGIDHTNQYSAPPGRSEHQTGLVMDVSTESVAYDLEYSFAETPEGTWLVDHVAQYGFIIRYPEGKEHITGYSYEPWHLRYVGRELAEYLYQNALTLDEYYGVSAENYEWTFDYDAVLGNGSASGTHGGSAGKPDTEPPDDAIFTDIDPDASEDPPTDTDLPSDKNQNADKTPAKPDKPSDNDDSGQSSDPEAPDKPDHNTGKDPTQPELPKDPESDDQGSTNTDNSGSDSENPENDDPGSEDPGSDNSDINDPDANLPDETEPDQPSDGSPSQPDIPGDTGAATPPAIAPPAATPSGISAATTPAVTGTASAGEPIS